MVIELLWQAIPVQANASKLVAELLHSPHGEVSRAALAALRSAPGTLTQQQEAELTPFLINTVLHDDSGLFVLPQGLHYSFHADSELAAKMREASEAALAREQAVALLRAGNA